MITLEIQTANATVEPITPAAGARRGSNQIWAIRREKLKDSQNRQCLCCGRGEARKHRLDPHHVKKVEHGGTDAFRNLIAVCESCHKLIHNVERDMPFVSRVILALQVLGPRESLTVTAVCRVLFRVFLRSTAANSFHPAYLKLRPMPSIQGVVA
jgi:hypothetical protein